MEVTVYSTHSCPWCVRVKDFLKENKVTFTEIYVDDDREKAMHMIEISGQTGVPVTDIDGEIVVGFDKPNLIKLLKLDKVKKAT